jgi:hypothetical protein
MLSLTKILLIDVTILASLWLLLQFAEVEFFGEDSLLPMSNFFSNGKDHAASILASLPEDNPASAQFAAWLSAFNTHNRTVLLAYHDRYFSFDVASPDIGTIDREIILSNGTGGFTVINTLNSSVEAGKHATVNVVLREKKKPRHYARAIMQVDISKDSHPVSSFDINPTHTPIDLVPDDRKKEFERALSPLTKARRTMLVQEISAVVREQYIFPDIGETIIQGLDHKVQEGGEYDDYEDSELFARRLTEDMQAIGGDKHMRIMFVEPPPPRKNEDGDDDEEKPKPEELFDLFRDVNFGFGQPEVDLIKSKKLGYLPIEGFVPSTPEIASDYTAIRKAIGDILSKIAHTDAVLIDLRTNGGGHPSTVAFVLSYLLDGPQHLNDMVDRTGNIKDSFSTLPAAELPPDTSRFGSSKPLFVLTSKQTISGGEEMAYDLQALKRANSVIGEDQTTAGAANPVTRARFIGEEAFGKGWWIVAMPDVRPVNEVTGGNWEGVGVKSDVVVKEGVDAREVGRKMAIEALGLEGKDEI